MVENNTNKAVNLVAESLFARIEERRKALKLSKRAVSLAGNNEYLLRDLEKRGSIPGGAALAGLANILHMSIEELLGHEPLQIRSDALVLDGPLAYKPQPARADLPVLGTAHGGIVNIIDGDNDTQVEQTLFEPTQIIRYITRPRALSDARDAYAIYVEGESMYPRFGPGEMAVVDPRVPPRIGDDVIVQLSENGDDEIHAILIKRLVRRSASFLELEQFNPPAIFRIDAARVKRLHRICPAGDLLGG